MRNMNLLLEINFVNSNGELENTDGVLAWLIERIPGPPKFVTHLDFVKLERSKRNVGKK